MKNLKLENIILTIVAILFFWFCTDISTYALIFIIPSAYLSPIIISKFIKALDSKRIMIVILIASVLVLMYTFIFKGDMNNVLTYIIVIAIILYIGVPNKKRK